MKRFFTFLIIALGVVQFIYSQVTMTRATHGFLLGMNHETQAVQNQAPGNSGKDCVWDFRQALPLEEIKSVSDLSNDNYGTGPIKVSRNDGCEFFFNTTELVNEYWGYIAGDAKLQYTEPIVKTKYPQTFNTQFSGKFSGTYSIEGSNYSTKVEGTYSTHADGIGIILLPGDISMPALRVKTIEVYSSLERVKYLWYAQDIRLPLFIILEDYSIANDGTKKLMNTQTHLNLKAQSPTGIQSLTNDAFAFQVFPNPFKDNLSVTFTLAESAQVTVALYTSDGANLTTLISNKLLQSGTQTISQDVSKFAQQAGVYLLKISIGDKTFTEKVVKAY